MAWVISLARRLSMNSLRLRIFAMVFVVVVVAIGTVMAGASQGSQTAVRGFLGFSAERDQHIAVQLLGSDVPKSSLPAVQVRLKELSQAMGANLLVIDPAGLVLVDSSNSLVG